MADNLDDEVFIVENGITDDNVPLIQDHDVQGGGAIAGFGLGDEFPDVAVANNIQVIQDDLGGNIPGVEQEEPLGLGMPENGLHLSMSSTHSSAQSFPSHAFEQGDMLGTSTPSPDTAAGCYVNECYQSSTSDLSEFNPSVEIQPGTQIVSFKGSSKKLPAVSDVKGNYGDDKPVESSCSSENKGTVAGFTESVNIEASTSAVHDNSEVIIPNPPNSPAIWKTRFSRPASDSLLLRRYRDRPLSEVPLDHPDRPSNVFRKYGSFLLILVFILLLAIIACLEGLLSSKSLVAIFLLWGLSFIGAIGCFLKACWEERDLVPERPSFRSSYGSTRRTRSVLSVSA